MNIQQIAKTHGVPVEAARAIVAAAVDHAESQLSLEYNSPAGRMQSEEAERALWLVRDFALAGTEISDEEKAEAALWLEEDDERKDWRYE